MISRIFSFLISSWSFFHDFRLLHRYRSILTFPLLEHPPKNFIKRKFKIWNYFIASTKFRINTITIKGSFCRFIANSKFWFSFRISVNFASRASLVMYWVFKDLVRISFVFSRCGFKVLTSNVLHFEQQLKRRSSFLFCFTSVTNCKQLHKKWWE